MLHRLEFGLARIGNDRRLEVETLHQVEDDLGDDEARGRLVVGRDHVPGGLLAARGFEAGFVGLAIVVPVGALRDVLGLDLPVLGGLQDAIEQALSLLLPGDMQEDLDDARAVLREVPLEAVDRAVALLPDALLLAVVGQRLCEQDLGVHPDDQHLLVIGAVEDRDLAALGKVARRAPEEVVAQFLGRRVGKAEDVAALRIDARHDVLDAAVLAGRIHGLEDDEDGVAVGRVEQLLQVAHALHVRFQQVLVLVLAGIDRLDARRPAVELHLRVGGDAIVLDLDLASHGRLRILAGQRMMTRICRAVIQRSRFGIPLRNSS